jgi:hypothetical protein
MTEKEKSRISEIAKHPHLSCALKALYGNLVKEQGNGIIHIYSSVTPGMAIEVNQSSGKVYINRLGQKKDLLRENNTTWIKLLESQLRRIEQKLLTIDAQKSQNTGRRCQAPTKGGIR